MQSKARQGALACGLVLMLAATKRCLRRFHEEDVQLQPIVLGRALQTRRLREDEPVDHVIPRTRVQKEAALQAEPELILLPQVLAFDHPLLSDRSERLFAHEISVDKVTAAQPDRMEQLLANATARTLAHKLTWWFVQLGTGSVPIVQYAAQSARLRASGVRIAVYTTRSHTPENRRGRVFIALEPDLTHRTRFDVLLSCVPSSGLPHAKPYTALRADGRLQFSLISHAHSLLSTRTLANLTATRRASARFRGRCRLLSLGDAGRAHTLSIRAAHALGVPVRVIGGTDETLDVDAARSECAALGGACTWDRARMGLVDFLREMEKPDVCAVSIPFINESAIKIGIGITTAIQVDGSSHDGALPPRPHGPRAHSHAPAGRRRSPEACPSSRSTTRTSEAT